MKKLYLLILSFTAVYTLQAQVSGYQGKRFSMGYSTYLSPRLKIGSNEIGDTRKWNIVHCIDFDYAIKPRVSFCAGVQFSKMDLIKYGSEFEKYDNGTYTRVLYTPTSKKDMETKGTNISLGFRFFRRGYLNPYGKYRKIEFILAMNEAVFDKRGFIKKPDYNLPSSIVSVSEQKYNSLVFAYTIGKQRILFNKLVLDYGVRVGLNLNYLFKISFIGQIMDELGDSESQEIDSRIKTAINQRLLGAQFLNAHIGLRFLAF